LSYSLIYIYLFIHFVLHNPYLFIILTIILYVLFYLITLILTPLMFFIICSLVVYFDYSNLVSKYFTFIYMYIFYFSAHLFSICALFI
jgi:hypothetical protein